MRGHRTVAGTVATTALLVAVAPLAALAIALLTAAVVLPGDPDRLNAVAFIAAMPVLVVAALLLPVTNAAAAATDMDEAASWALRLVPLLAGLLLLRFGWWAMGEQGPLNFDERFDSTAYLYAGAGRQLLGIGAVFIVVTVLWSLRVASRNATNLNR